MPRSISQLVGRIKAGFHCKILPTSVEWNSLQGVSFFFVDDSNQSGDLGTVFIVVLESKSFKFSSEVQPQYTRYFKVSMLGLELLPFVVLTS